MYTIKGLRHLQSPIFNLPSEFQSAINSGGEVLMTNLEGNKYFITSNTLPSQNLENHLNDYFAFNGDRDEVTLHVISKGKPAQAK